MPTDQQVNNANWTASEQWQLNSKWTKNIWLWQPLCSVYKLHDQLTWWVSIMIYYYCSGLFVAGPEHSGGHRQKFPPAGSTLMQLFISLVIVTNIHCPNLVICARKRFDNPAKWPSCILHQFRVFNQYNVTNFYCLSLISLFWSCL